MATRLKNLRVKKVDFVDAGANPDADIKLFKGQNMVSGPLSGSGETGIWKKLFGFIGKAAGLEQNEIDSAVEEIKKAGAVSFNERFSQTRNSKIADEIWDLCYALQSSMCSILNDEDLDSADASVAMQESLDEFQTVAQGCIKQWSEGRLSSIVVKKEDITEFEMELMKSARDRLSETIEKSSVVVKEQNNNEPKGDQEMKIDKSRLTPAEAAFLEDIEKRCGTEEGAGAVVEPVKAVAEVQTAAPPVAKSTVPPTETGGEQTADLGEPGTDIYKGLHPAVRAELESFKKFREDAEARELKEVAKKYEIIGKKPEELVPVLKSMKEAGGTAYDDMIAVLDQTVETVEKSGAFSEIGKSGAGSPAGTSSEAKISSIAKSYMEKDPSLSYQAAVAKAWEDNLDIMEEYDEEAGF